MAEPPREEIIRFWVGTQTLEIKSAFSAWTAGITKSSIKPEHCDIGDTGKALTQIILQKPESSISN